MRVIKDEETDSLKSKVGMISENLLRVFLLRCLHVQIAFLKFTSCDNQALIGCIPIAAVPVPLNVKS